MKDRTSTYPGRVKLVPVAGMENTYTMTFADEPLQEGTPLNKATLLSDTVAAALRLPQEDSTVNDALGAIAAGFGRVTAAERGPDINEIGKAGDLFIDLSKSFEFIYSIYLCLGVDENNQYIWASLAVFQKVLRTEIIKESTTWEVPSGILGDIRVLVYGAGGSGATQNIGGAGGGGGTKNEWVGRLTALDSIPITIGSGGISVTGSKGNAGGSTSFGSIVSAPGGSGGGNSSSGFYGGNGGSGGGAGVTTFTGGKGSQFGSGGSRDVSPTAGVNTNSIETDSFAKGTGAAGTNASSGGYGGGGGYGGKGGNGQANGGGGGGGFGSSGNGGNGGSSTTGSGGKGGYGAGGGGAYKGVSTGAGGDGICMIEYTIMEAK